MDKDILTEFSTKNNEMYESLYGSGVNSTPLSDINPLYTPPTETTPEDRPIPGIDDLWRLANLQANKVNLSNLKTDLTVASGQLAEVKESKEFVNSVIELNELNLLYDENQLTDEQKLRKQQLTDYVNQTLPKVKDAARYNPFLRRIFYDVFASPNDLGLSLTDASRIGANLFEHETDYKGRNYTNIEFALNVKGTDRFLAPDELSPEAVDTIWNAKTDLTNNDKLRKQLLELNEAEKDSLLNTDERNSKVIQKLHTIHNGNWLFDPARIDSKVLETFETNKVDWSDPLSVIYGLPHIGSSYAEVGAMLTSMGTAALMKKATGSALIAAGAAFSGPTAGTSSALIPVGLALTELGTNYAVQRYARDQETKSELFDAYQQRITDTIQSEDKERASNMYGRLMQSVEELRKLGYDVDNMTEQEKFGALIANSNLLEDTPFADILEEGKKGLSKLEQLNTGLMALDLLEAGIYSFGGSYIRNLRRLLKADPSGVRLRNISEQLLEGETTLAGRALKALNDKIYRAAVRNTASTSKKLAAKRIIDGVSEIAGKALKSAPLEMLEEGTQYIGSERYQSGMYDEFKSNASLIEGALDANLLGMEALSAYFGIHPDNTLNTDEELRNSMNIGALTSLFTNAAYSTPSVYRGIRLLQTDKRLLDKVGYDFGSMEDDQKIDAFLQASRSGGILRSTRYNRLNNTLDEISKLQLEDNINDIIEHDKSLLNKVYDIESSNTTKDNVKALKISKDTSKGSNLYNMYVKNAVHIMDRTTNARNDYNKSEANYNSVRENIRQELLDNAENSLIDMLRPQLKATAKDDLKDLITREFVVDAIISSIEHEITSELYDNVSKLSNDLDRLQQELNLNDVNTYGIRFIRDFLLEHVGTSMFKQEGMAGSYFNSIKQQLLTPLIAHLLNSAVFTQLAEHRNAYLTGLQSESYDNLSSIKPYYNTLSNLEQQAVTERLQQELGKELSQSEVLNLYDNEIERDFILELDTDRLIALATIRMDLRRRMLQEEQSEQESNEFNGTVVNEDNGEIVADDNTDTSTVPQQPAQQETPTTDVQSTDDSVTTPEPTTDLQPSEDTTTVTYSEDSNSDKTDDELANLIEQLKQTEDEDETPNANQQLPGVQDESDLIDDVGELSEEDAKEIQQDLLLGTAVTREEETLLGTAVTREEETLLGTAVTREEETLESTPRIKKGFVGSKSDQPEDLAPLSTENAEQFASDDVLNEPVTESSDNAILNEEGNPVDLTTVDPMLLSQQEDFDENYDRDSSGVVSPTDVQNTESNARVTPGIDTLEKLEKDLISHTFFYRPDSDTTLTLNANGKPIQFYTKTGEKATLATGKLLAEKLAIPGWLSSADDMYYFITDKFGSFDRSSVIENPVEQLGVHLAIEKDGVVYVVSLRNRTTATRSMNKLGLSPEHQQHQLDALMDLRRSIISAVCANYSSDGKLPDTPDKSVRPINIRISNGTINNQKNGLTSIFRNLSEVEDLGIPTDPYQLTQMLENGDIEIGYGVGPLGLAQPFSIISLSTGEPTSRQGKGYAGKLYIIPKASQTPSQEVAPPIMLSEKKFDDPSITNPDQIEMVFDSKHNRLLDKPLSAVEAIYEMTVGTLFNEELDDFLLTLLCNTGSRTASTFEGRNDLDWYKRKVFLRYIYEASGEPMLAIGMSKDYSKLGRNAKYEVVHLKINAINDPVKKHILFSIMKNMHWNTDKEFLMSRIPQFVVDFVVNAAKNNMQNLTEDTKFTLGIKEVQFSLKDVGYTIKDGLIVKRTDDTQPPSIFSWLINNGKIQTNLGDRLFRGPFVYASGTQLSELSTKSQANLNTPATKQTKTINTKEDKTESTPTERPKALACTKENIEKYGLELPTKQLRKGYQYIIAFDNKSGKPKIIQVPVGKAKQLGISETYSSKKGKGKVNTKKEKAWLMSKLGLDESQIAVDLNNIVNLHGDNKVYGVMKLSFDAITKRIGATIGLAKNAGEGIAYHEGFHYVSLLLLSNKERQAVYASYRNKLHDDNISDKDIEELIAEDFRAYMLGARSIFQSYPLIKLYKTIARYIPILDKLFSPSLHTELYARIKAGVFALSKPLQENIYKLFNQDYPEGVVYNYIPGLSTEDMKNLPNILDSNTFYNVVESLAYSCLAYSGITKVEDLETGINLDTLYEQLQEQLDCGLVAEEYISLTEDILNNKPIFNKYITEYLRGLKLDRFVQEDKEQLVADGLKDNTFDKELGDESKLNFAPSSVKLLFYSIPDSKYVLVQDEKGNVTKLMELVTEPIFGMSTPVSFSLAWTKTLEALWDVDSYLEILDRCAILGKTDPFFLNLADRLLSSDIDDNLRKLIECTIKSSKNKIISLLMTRHKVNEKSLVGLSDEAIKDVTEATSKLIDFKVQSSDDLRKIARYPKIWNLAFLTSSFVEKDDNGNMYISQNSVTYLLQTRDTITRALADKNTDLAYNSLIALFNFLLMPVDSLTMNMILENTGETERLEQINKLWRSDKKGSIKALLKNLMQHLNPNAKHDRRIDKLFTSRDKNSIVNQIAVAYGTLHVSPGEFSVTGADGALIYPISENNYMSDQIRWLNGNKFGKRNNILNSDYGKSSLLAKNAGDLELNTLVALEDENNTYSKDYFGITPLEDYICKLLLTNDGYLILPTMADKKTWYAISGLLLAKEMVNRFTTSTTIDPLTGVSTSQTVIIDPVISNTLHTVFLNYLTSEIDTIKSYFRNKSTVEKNPNLYRANYHGKIVNGKMQPGGNGGRFRHFTSLFINGKMVYLNDQLDKLERNHSDADVMKFLEKLQQQLKKPNTARTIINKFIQDLVDTELKNLVNMGVITENGGIYQNKLIPDNIIKQYQEMYSSNKNYTANISLRNSDIIRSIVTTHVAIQAISINELERCFTGDLAFYEYNTVECVYKMNDDTFEPIPDISIDDYIKLHPEEKKLDFATFTRILDTHVDKTKRLSAVLSTGTNLSFDPGESTKYNVLNLGDDVFEIPYTDLLRKHFKRDLVIKHLLDTGEYTDINQVYKDVTVDNVDEKLNSLPKEVQDVINKSVAYSIKPYTKNKSTDGAAYMRPALWRRVCKALGKWDDNAEAAYNILENDEDWASNPDKTAIVNKFILNVLKMVYMGDTPVTQLKLDVPVFNKMAIFPMFKFMSTGDNKLLYNRMNDKSLGEIDMYVFDSAVKAGASTKINPYVNGRLNKQLFNKTSTKNIVVQDLRNIRLQLNTDPHEHVDRAAGTQAIKMLFSNLRDDLFYGKNKGISKTGKLLKTEIIDCINCLTDLGAKDIIKEFFIEDENGYIINNKKLSNYLIKSAIQSGLPSEFIEGLKLDENGDFITPLEASSYRGWIENRINAYINKTIIDINTKGGAAIQMSAFGFERTQVIEESGDYVINNGNPLKLVRDDGSSEVVLSMNFFRHVLPKELKDAPFMKQREWLLKNNIIGDKAKPFGLAYRIPTQGSSSIMAFTVMDVLPFVNADTIIVPDGFTAMTGSDFDIDKLYIMTKEYKDGKLVKYDDSKDVVQLNGNQLRNKMIDDYIVCISDSNNMAETKASIDVLTSILKKEILPLIMSLSKFPRLAGYSLLPSFQSGIKNEYYSGKLGIGPFALNSTNHALTQLTHLSIRWNKVLSDMQSLDEIYGIKGRDDYRILDWLSAMINAHVDVAKDPYIINLNVNKITYNVVNLLLRTGFGKSTLLFLALPILKELASRQLALSGFYGNEGKTRDQVYRDILYKYLLKLYEAIDTMSNDDDSASTDTLNSREIVLAQQGYKKGDPQKHPEIDYVFTENAEAYMVSQDTGTADTGTNLPSTWLEALDKFPNEGTTKLNVSDVNGTNQSGIRTDREGNISPNAYGIVVKKYQLDARGKFVSKEGQFQDTDEDFNLFVMLNLDMFERLAKSGNNSVIFPTKIAKGKAALPMRFAKWLQMELYNRFGITSVIAENERSDYDGYGLDLVSVPDSLNAFKTNKYNLILKYNGILMQLSDNKKIQRFPTVPIIKNIEVDFNDALSDTKNIEIFNQDFNNLTDYYYHQIIVLLTYNKLQADALLLSDLVKYSKIDTKKFGNTIITQINYKNGMRKFRESKKFYITTVETDEDSALSKYYSKTFLGKKYFWATELFSKVLAGQLLYGTKQFKTLFNSVIKLFLDYEADEDTAASQIDDLYAEKIGVTIDSIMRARIASTTGLKTTTLEFRDMIMGPNSIVKQLSRLRRYIYDNARKFPELIDNDGNITNKLLNFIVGIAGNNIDSTVDTIVTDNSTMNNDLFYESLLVSAFDQLLTHSDDKIRSFAEQLVKYAFYSYYDNPTVSNIFKYVPNWYKQQIGYTSAIRDCIKQMDSNDNIEVSAISQDIDNASNGNYPSILTVMARNLWNDPNVAPLLYTKQYSVVCTGELGMPLLLTSNKTIPFVTIQTTQGTQLYAAAAMIGVIDKKEGNVVGAKTIYKLILKLGLLEKNTSFYEYGVQYNSESVYKLNYIPKNNLLDAYGTLTNIKTFLDRIVGLTVGFRPDNNELYDVTIDTIDNFNISIKDDHIDFESDWLVDPSYDEYSAFDSTLATEAIGTDTFAGTVDVMSDTGTSVGTVDQVLSQSTNTETPANSAVLDIVNLITGVLAVSKETEIPDDVIALDTTPDPALQDLYNSVLNSITTEEQKHTDC